MNELTFSKNIIFIIYLFILNSSHYQNVLIIVVISYHPCASLIFNELGISHNFATCSSRSVDIPIRYNADDRIPSIIFIH